MSGVELSDLVPEPAIEYREPCQPGEVAILRDGGSSWVASPDGVLHASIVHSSSPEDAVV